MATSPLSPVLFALGADVSSGEPDGELLTRYATTTDEAAFALLVRRYGRLVWRVARTRCRTESTAEEVFQATFVVLARKAATIRTGGALPGWLHRTAYRLAVRAARRERPTAPLPTDLAVSNDPLDTLSARELLAAVDDEMAKLSDTERSVLVLCGVEGGSLDEAATRLGCTVGAVKGRLERARVKLRHRLDARGLTLPAVVLSLIGPPAASTVQAATLAATGGTLRPPVAALLAHGVSMKGTITKAALGVVLLGTLFTVGNMSRNAGAPAVHAAPVPRALKTPTEAWGEAVDGLQAGLRMPGGTVVEPGKAAELQVVVRNVSRKSIAVTYTAQQLGVSVLGDHKDGGVRLFWGMYINGITPQPQTHTLDPGGELVRWTLQVRHSPDDDKTPPGSHVDLPAGKYRFEMNGIGGDMMNFSNLGDLPAFDRLATGTLEVVLPEPNYIKAPVPKDKQSAVVWSEPVKVDWQTSGAERIAGVWMPDGKSVAVPRPTLTDKGDPLTGGGIDLRDADTGKVLDGVKFRHPSDTFTFIPTTIVTSGDGKLLAAAGTGFDPANKAASGRSTFAWPDLLEGKQTELTYGATTLALSSDGKQFAVLIGSEVNVSDAATGKILWLSKVGGGMRGKPTSLTFNAPDNAMAVGTDDGVWLTLDAKSGRVLSSVTNLGVSVRSTASSADGKNLAFGGKPLDGGQALVLLTGKDVLKLPDAVPEKEAINGLAFSPDGKLLAAACSDGVVRVFEVDGGKVVASAKEHTEEVFSVAYSPDGKKLLTVGRDAMKVWDVEAVMKAK
jgi:RNA polymerase sigma factor (sigma-70 family)